MCKYHKDMKYTHISITGNIAVEYDTRLCSKVGDLIVTGLTNKSAGCRYAVSNNEFELQNMINSVNLKDTPLITSIKLYKKYMFFDNVDYVPSFPDSSALNVNEQNCSSQLLSLLLACWCEYNKVYVFGYDIEDLNERDFLIRVVENNPTTEFFYVRKPNITKIKIFDKIKNLNVIDYKEFTSYAKKTK